MPHSNATPDGQLTRSTMVTAICQAIVSLLDEGELRYNDRLPAERILSARFATTRITLREALGQLEAQGKIYRLERRGWFVSPPRLDYNPLNRSHFHAIVREQGRRPDTYVLDVNEIGAPAAVSRHLGLATGEQVYCIRRVRHIDGRAVLYVEHYLNPAFFPGILQEDLTQSLTELYLKRYGIRYGKVWFGMLPTIFPPSATLALKTSENSPALFITRINRNQHDQIIDCDLEYWRYDTLHISVEAQ
ncbi:UTRA domain-containing protein [Brenneria izbisi]